MAESTNLGMTDGAVVGDSARVDHGLDQLQLLAKEQGPQWLRGAAIKR
eukprot:CAMPEP_0113579912 /NCGR_PEP_ID=MMETSP0015_2-20120614/30349_1 /TAXON_ID=2838 /ORGANISM="Odontella" /LENGTH=47 /DNA_ID=CAMNT_0000483979 /DNA_START=458 /DNA_END=601 /DNA_ORIENTATION=+ /assembly_acc=CAM_ASM_000160